MGDILRDTLAAMAAKVTFPYPEIAPFVKSFTNVAQVYTSSVTGTGASLPVTVPGTPRVALAFNRSAPCLGFKAGNMATKYGMKLTGAPALTYSDEIMTFSANTLTFGTDADLNTAAEVIEYVVWI